MEENLGKEKKTENILELMPYLRRGDGDLDLQPENREKIKKIEAKKNQSKPIQKIKEF